MLLLLTILAVLLILVISEILWRAEPVHDEFSRKFVHITVGSFVAFWPFYLSWNDIRVLSLAFLVGVVISKALNIFKAIHSVQRPTWGEIFFAIVVGGMTFVTHNKWIYMAALLQMSLADGLAAVIGTRYGKKRQYRAFGHTKSVIGTATFFIVSVLILLGYAFVAPGVGFSAVLFLIAALAATMENFGVYGLDNIFVPLLIALGLRFIY